MAAERLALLAALDVGMHDVERQVIRLSVGERALAAQTVRDIIGGGENENMHSRALALAQAEALLEGMPAHADEVAQVELQAQRGGPQPTRDQIIAEVMELVCAVRLLSSVCSVPPWADAARPARVVSSCSTTSWVMASSSSASTW